MKDGSKELGDQITRLMGTLNRSEQGTHPASTPNSSRHRGCGRGRMERNTPAIPNSHNGWTGLDQNTSAQSSSAASRVATASQSRGSTLALTGAQGNAQNVKDSSVLQCFRCQGWGYMARECTTLAKPLNKDGGEPRECSQTPCNPQSINSQHSLPDPDPKLTHMKAARRKGWQQVTPIPFLNPDPIAHLVGHSSEAPVIIDRQEVTALIDFGGSGVEYKCSVLQRAHLANPASGSVIGARGDRGAAIPYLRSVEVNLQIPGIRNYNEDVLLLVIPTTTYSKTVLVMVGTKIIDKALSLMTAGELAKATTTWRQAHLEQSCLGSCNSPVAAQIKER